MVYEFVLPLLASAVLGFFCISGCNSSTGPEETQEFREAYKVEDGTRMAVYNENGTIRISKWDKDYVEVYAMKKTRRGKSELEKVKIDVSIKADMVIRTEYVKKDARVSVDYEIRIPGEVIVDHVDNSNGKIELEGTKGDAVVSTSNGEIDMKNVDGRVSAATSNGKISIVGTTGVLRAETSNGNIKIEMSDIKDDVSVVTSNGSIELHISPELNANIEMTTSNGKLSIHDIEMVTSESSSRRIRGELGDGGSRIYLKTSNGKIDLYKL